MEVANRLLGKASETRKTCGSSEEVQGFLGMLVGSR
jgi:hypothetical protein